MKHRMYLLLITIIIGFNLLSCAVSEPQQENVREAAMATQRLGEEQYRHGRFTAALKNLLEAEKSLSDDPTLHNSLGLVYMAKERPVLAEKHFKKALELKPDYAQVQNNLGALYMKEKKWKLATQMFEAVSENLLYPTPEIPLSNLGWVYYNQYRFKQAQYYFNLSLDFRPNFINSVHGLASVYIKQKKYSNALSFINEALKKNPGAAILHADLARSYEGTGEIAKARNAWAVVLKLVPERSPLAKEAARQLAALR